MMRTGISATVSIARLVFIPPRDCAAILVQRQAPRNSYADNTKIQQTQIHHLNRQRRQGLQGNQWQSEPGCNHQIGALDDKACTLFSFASLASFAVNSFFWDKIRLLSPTGYERGQATLGNATAQPHKDFFYSHVRPESEDKLT